MEELDYLGIFKEFNKKKIKYIVCGGIAVNLLGIPRMTYDLDLLLKLEDENLNKFVKLMKRLGYKAKIPVDIEDFAKKKKRDDWIKNKDMKAFCLVNPKATVKEIDIVIDSPVTYDKAITNTKKIKLQRMRIPVIGIKDLIKMKKKSGRKQDYSDIRYLEVKLEEQKE